jgi:hypothetical protein
MANKTERLTIRMTPEHRELIERYAKSRGFSSSQLVVEIIDTLVRDPKGIEAIDIVTGSEELGKVWQLLNVNLAMERRLSVGDDLPHDILKTWAIFITQLINHLQNELKGYQEEIIPREAGSRKPEFAE